MIENFKPMRSVAPDLQKFPLQLPVLASVKLDGIRIAKPQAVGLSKSGKAVPNVFTRDWVNAHVPDGLDTEFLVGEPASEDAYGLSFSAYSRYEGEPDFKLYVLDTCDDLRSYATERYDRVKNLVDSCSAEVKARLVVVEQHLLHSMVEVQAFYDYALEQGYEGMITKRPDSTYKYGRATTKEQTQLKWKPEKDSEARIVGLYEGMTNLNEKFTNEVGESKRSTHQANKVPNGMLGGFTVNENGVIFNVAPGKMKHSERISVWQAHLKDPSTYPGRLIKHRSMDYGNMTNGAARQGRWIGWRDETDMD